ncbi:uncharacterized protein [Diabrotica undecimpunctata]|uniref:uncharacterized protein n=1 Tax=Diabrotica undecimpunctata TaxID=50387 RepID=UPI003B63D1EA
MTQGTVKSTKKHVLDKIFQEVISGNYPAHNVNKMNISRLKHLVVRLVEFTSIQVSAKIRSPISETNLTNNWSLDSDVLVPKLQNNKKNYKEFRSSLKRVVIDCSDFFKTCTLQWPPHGKSFENDENFDFIQTKAEKRKLRNSYSESNVSKRRKILLPCTEKKFTSEPYIPLSRCIPGPQEPSKPLSQSEFLGTLKLNLNNNEIPKPQVPNSSRPNRLQNCPNIPFSSDLGQFLIKLENHKVPSSVSERKLDKLQWYINKNSQPMTNVPFEVNYCQNKKNNNHKYKFPIRQYHQLLGDHDFENFKYKLCKPLTVKLQNEDLVSLKKHYNKFKMKVRVKRLTESQIKSVVAKKPKVEKKNVCKVVIENSTFNQPKVLLVNNGIKNVKVVSETKKQLSPQFHSKRLLGKHGLNNFNNGKDVR